MPSSRLFADDRLCPQCCPQCSKCTMPIKLRAFNGQIGNITMYERNDNSEAESLGSRTDALVSTVPDNRFDMHQLERPDHYQHQQRTSGFLPDGNDLVLHTTSNALTESEPRTRVASTASAAITEVREDRTRTTGSIRSKAAEPDPTSDLSEPASTIERRQLKNRTAQKRFRDRQKASISVPGFLCAT